jgi:hypothetical protein
LAEAEGRLHAVERQRDQPLAVAAKGGLIPDPVGFDRGGRPQHEDDVGAFQRIVDRLGIGRAALDQRIPPDVVAGFLERPGELGGPRFVGMCIAQEEREALGTGRFRRRFRHPLPPERDASGMTEGWPVAVTTLRMAGMGGKRTLSRYTEESISESARATKQG